MMTLDLKPVWLLLGGSVLLLVSLSMLASNESNVLAYRAAAMRHGGIVVNASHGPTQANNGEMVRVAGMPRIVRQPVDPWFGIRADVPIMWRVTEMYQWREIDYAGSTDYELEWVDYPVDSSSFKNPSHHHNPASMPFGSQRFLAGEVRLGGFLLSPKLVLAMPGRQDITPDFGNLRPNMAASFRPYKGALVTSQHLDSPELGDLRVSWQAAPLQEVTVIALNQNGTLVPASGVADGAGFQLQVGKLPVVDLQPDLPGVPYMPWLWRILSLLLAASGCYVLLRTAPLRGPVALPALGIAIVLVCGLAGVMWVSSRSDIGILLIGTAVLALGMTAWRLFQRPQS